MPARHPEGAFSMRRDRMLRRIVFSLLMAMVLSVPVVAQAQNAKDAKGAQDHPALGARYPGSTIVRYSVQKFDAFALLLGPAKDRGKPGKHEKLEGKVTRISYEIGKGRTTLEVLRNYEKLFADKDFEVLYACANQDCGGRAFNHTVVPYWSGFSENYEDQRYVALAKKGTDGGVYVSFYVVRNYSEGGPRKDRVYVQLDVVELTKMDLGMEVVDASKMKQAIDAHGHIALYGILFDTDSARLRDESQQALGEIAKLMKAQPALKLYVVGHTDNQGALDYNLKLSRARAESVVAYLTSRQGIAAGRLQAHGLAFLAPIASNASEQGRQKNRRVVLVEM